MRPARGHLTPKMNIIFLSQIRCWLFLCQMDLTLEKIFINITLQICNQGPPKGETWPRSPPPFTPSEVEGVRIVIIPFRNIAKNWRKIPNTFSENGTKILPLNNFKQKNYVKIRENFEQICWKFLLIVQRKLYGNFK